MRYVSTRQCHNLMQLAGITAWVRSAGHIDEHIRAFNGSGRGLLSSRQGGSHKTRYTVFRHGGAPIAMIHLPADVGAAFIVERSVSAAIVGLQLN